MRDYKKYDVFDVVDTDEETDNIIDTDWVLIETEEQDGTKVIKVRLCLTGDREETLHKICREAPTANNRVGQKRSFFEIQLKH